MTRSICDICNKPIEPGRENHISFKYKECRKKINIFGIMDWKVIDICPKCVELIEKLRKEGQDEDNEST